MENQTDERTNSCNLRCDCFLNYYNQTRLQPFQSLAFLLPRDAKKEEFCEQKFLLNSEW